MDDTKTNMQYEVTKSLCTLGYLSLKKRNTMCGVDIVQIQLHEM